MKRVYTVQGPERGSEKKTRQTRRPRPGKVRHYVVDLAAHKTIAPFDPGSLGHDDGVELCVRFEDAAAALGKSRKQLMDAINGRRVSRRFCRDPETGTMRRHLTLESLAACYGWPKPVILRALEARGLRAVPAYEGHASPILPRG